VRVEEVARCWKITPKSVYRFIEQGLLPAAVRARDTPLIGYDVDPTLVERVSQELNLGLSGKRNIKRILKQIKERR